MEMDFLPRSLVYNYGDHNFVESSKQMEKVLEEMEMGIGKKNPYKKQGASSDENNEDNKIAYYYKDQKPKPQSENKVRES